jgi:hypothetical protein
MPVLRIPPAGVEEEGGGVLTAIRTAAGGIVNSGRKPYKGGGSKRIERIKDQ